MKNIIVKGQASGKAVSILKADETFTGSLMDFLMKQKITIASSCAGAGTCKKCVVNGDLLCCQISLKDFIKDHETSVVEVTYL